MSVSDNLGYCVKQVLCPIPLGIFKWYLQYLQTLDNAMMQTSVKRVMDHCDEEGFGICSPLHLKNSQSGHHHLTD